MLDSDPKPVFPRHAMARRQRGVAAVEFSGVAIFFFALVFGILEIARAMYLINTLQEVTRRAAAMAADSRFDAATVDAIRREALFKDTDGNLVLGRPITPSYLKIDYLRIARDAGTGALSTQPVTTMPACPATNRLNCLTDPYGPSCIRLVRVRICQPGDAECGAVPYQMLFPLVDLSEVKLPTSETVVPVQNLGYTMGSMPCP